MPTRKTGNVGGSFLSMPSVSKKNQGIEELVPDHRADNPDSLAYPRSNNRGEGSSMVFGTLREQAVRVRSERDVPGSLGYKTSVDITQHKNKRVEE